MLLSQTVPVSRPYPRSIVDKNDPAIEAKSRRLVPYFCQMGVRRRSGAAYHEYQDSILQ